MITHPQTFIFIGRSGSGKGTQAKRLQDYLSAHDPASRSSLYLEMGGLFKQFLSGQDNYTVGLAKELAKTGSLQPPFLAVALWANALAEHMGSEKHLITDGTPRVIDEAKMLDAAIRFYKREQPTIIYIDVSREWSKDRLAGRGRADDVIPEAVQRRLDWFDADVVPTIEYLKNNPLYRFITVNGEQTIEEVHQEIIAKAFV